MVELGLRLLLAALLGAVIGINRGRLEWAAGLRTHMLVCVGSALAVIVSTFGFFDVLGRPGIQLDPSRIAAQVVSGVGFLGAGTILFLQRERAIRGLTTAAGLWAVASVGLAAGAGTVRGGAHGDAADVGDPGAAQAAGTTPCTVARTVAGCACALPWVRHWHVSRMPPTMRACRSGASPCVREQGDDIVDIDCDPPLPRADAGQGRAAGPRQRRGVGGTARAGRGLTSRAGGGPSRAVAADGGVVQQPAAASS